jgi:hypothetical protein
MPREISLAEDLPLPVISTLRRTRPRASIAIAMDDAAAGFG